MNRVRHTIARTTLIALLAGFCVLGSSTAVSQVPNVQVYFDANFTLTSAPCGFGGPIANLYVVANNFNIWIAAIEFMVALPPALTYIGETTTAPVVVGNALSGVAMSWATGQDAFGALGVSTIIAVWNCVDCLNPLYQDNAIVVLPFPVSGQVRARGWPHPWFVDAVGLTSIICPQSVPIEETSWGQVKALYR